MTKASDNEFPKLILAMQTTDPVAPSDSGWKTYAKAGGIYARSSNAIVGPFGAGSGTLTIEDEGTPLATAATTLDFVGAGVTASGTGAEKTITIPGGGTTVTFARKTANEDKSSTSFADSTDMGLAVAANKVYRFRYVVHFTTNATTVGIKLSVNGPAGATVRFAVVQTIGAPAGAGNAIAHGTTGSFDGDPIGASAGPGGGGGMALVEGIIATAGTAGTLILRHASETATITTILANSYGELIEIA